MQIRLSWQALLAALIFIIALGLIGSTLLRSGRASGPLPTAAGAVDPDRTAGAAAGGAAGGANTPVQAATATAAPSPSPEPTSTAVATIEPSPTPLPPTSTATASPAPTDTPVPTAVPTQTPFVVPTREPTPVPQRLVVERVGFGQRNEEMSYAFVVANPNQNMLVRNTLFQVAIYDANGTVLRTDGGLIPLIGPGQTMGWGKLLTLPLGNTVDRVEVQIRDGAFALTSERVPELPVENKAFVDGEIQRITGIVRNPLSFDLENLGFVGIAYENGTIVGGGDGLVPFIPAQGQAAVDIETATSAAPDTVEIYPLIDIVGGS